MKRFKEFSKEESVLSGDKSKISEILNKEIIVTEYRIRGSKYASENNDKCLHLQYKLDDKEFVLFTGSQVLMEQVEKYKDEIPFLTTIIKINNYFTMS
jgi:hypothetical protein